MDRYERILFWILVVTHVMNGCTAMIGDLADPIARKACEAAGGVHVKAKPPICLRAEVIEPAGK